MFFFVIAIMSLDFVGSIGIPGRIDVQLLWIYDAMHPVVGLVWWGEGVVAAARAVVTS
ncbi:MAG: hypothetical protein ACREFL_01385 [Stellaceae bacterium]